MLSRIFAIGALVLFLSPVAMAASAGGACTVNGALERDGAQTLVCNGSVWNLVMTHDTAGQTLLRVGVDAGACTAAKHGQLNFNGSTLTICDAESEAWVDVAPSAGGGGVTFAGFTPTTYTGDLGSYRGARDKCNAAFAGSRMMTTDDLHKVVGSLTSGQIGWIMCMRSGTNGHCLESSVNQTTSSVVTQTCYGWTSSTSSYVGYVVSGTNGGVGQASCNGANKIACVRDN